MKKTGHEKSRDTVPLRATGKCDLSLSLFCSAKTLFFCLGQ